MTASPAPPVALVEEEAPAVQVRVSPETSSLVEVRSYRGPFQNVRVQNCDILQGVGHGKGAKLGISQAAADWVEGTDVPRPGTPAQTLDKSQVRL